jgi:iron-sulfur cluster repair protein YtfE (RIC family)
VTGIPGERFSRIPAKTKAEMMERLLHCDALMQPQLSHDSTSITARLSADHARLDALLMDVCRMVTDGELERADYVFGDFYEGLLAHIALEEQILFPVFERTTGIFKGPTQVMRYEHDQIRTALGQMRSALDHFDAKAFEKGRRALTAILPSHDHKEERVLYPAMDRAIAPAEREDILRRFH